MQAVHQERESRRKGSAQKDSKKWKAAGIPLERVVFMAAHPGLRELQEQAKRQALEAQWAERILKEPLSKIRAEWFQQPPFSTSPRMAEQPQSEADSWMELLPPARLSDLFRSLLLGHQEDEREALQGWVELLDSARFLWIAGERDRKFVQLLHELQDLGVPGEFWMCPEAGHAVFLDSPEDLAERIRQFLI
jgi:2-succinyl-6-hydroxy-2,4-cyclohexadiene-1-carboxylate synthase